MGEANCGKSFQTTRPKKNNENPTNLLLRFSPEKPRKIQLSNSEPQLDLSLRLSLGGVYSEHFKEKPITRSSSVAGVMTKKVIAGDSNSTLPGIFLSLTRSCSLPVGSEQGHFRLKELQAKRMEAQTRLLEKQRRYRGAPEEEESSDEAAIVSPPSAVADWAVSSAARSAALCRAIVKIKTEGYASGKRKHDGLECVGAEKGATNSQSLPNPNPKDNDPVVIPGATANGKSDKLSETKLEKPPKKIKVSRGCSQHNGMDVMKQMPSVTTTGDGPNGKRIEGVLYKYMKGQVSIVCVCHGSFLSPAEFVKHAGGKDVENPMKHINVCPTF
ncbi:ninja-family protein 6-like isoform X1 [Corylus avellana]|uniref:ninja-family protein 6-like isoform X1 n=1 Tax=Corylus avellana TaxID=13451 RepID=UPI001E1F9CB4|nr:ninja-family protein 6-like isoform X1 [Corylus avellana]